ncbi:MAG: TSUP family transporter, partial [Anaerolineae bacterium]
MALSFESLFLIALAAGLVGALTGMGGGVILVPALTFLGIDIKHAIAASLQGLAAAASAMAQIGDDVFSPTDWSTGAALSATAAASHLGAAKASVAAINFEKEATDEQLKQKRLHVKGAMVSE